MAQQYDGPKQLLPVAGKPLVEHTLAALPDAIDELIFIVGGPYERAIREHFGSEHGGRAVTFLRQPVPKGLGHAIQCARGAVRGRFLTLVPDDLYDAGDLEALIAQDDLAALAIRHEHPEHFGVFDCDDSGCLLRTVEKPTAFVSDLISTAAYLLDEEFFEVRVPPSARGEIELPDIVNALVQERGRRVRVLEASFWMPVNTPEQLDAADAVMRKRLGAVSGRIRSA